MKHLIRGAESKERLALLLLLTNIPKGAMVKAIHDHLEDDSKRSLPIGLAARKNGIEPCNLSRSLATLDEATRVHEALNELEDRRFISVK